MKSLTKSKDKISVKLTLYFTTALVVFSIIVGSIFIPVFREYTINVHKENMLARAKAIAETMPTYILNQQNSNGGHHSYLNFVGDIAGDVWIIDKNYNLILSGRGRNSNNSNFKYKQLPENAELLVQEVFEDKTEFSESFSELQNELTLTLGMPIKADNGEIIGVVLLHSSVDGINDAVYKGIGILLISILIALVVGVFLSTFLSRIFFKSLNEIHSSILELYKGNYSNRVTISQKDEIGDLAIALNTLGERLEVVSLEQERLETLRQDFITNISHELRIPVTVVKGSLEALTQKVVTDKDTVEDYYVQMLNEVNFLERLVNDLLELSKLQNTDFVITKTDIFLNDVLSDVIRSAKRLAVKKNVEIRYTENNENIYLFGDYQRLRQMILIIINNAIKFSDEYSFIEIKLIGNKLYIIDNGCGISEDELPYIFDKFYKTRSENNKDGTGLGLPIAKEIANRHDILILAKNNDTQGTTFVFNFINHKKNF